MPSNGVFKYEYYEGNRNIKKATSATNVVYTFTYDSSGSPLKSRVGDTTDSTITDDTKLYMESTGIYTSSGNYLKALIDNEENSVITDYDEVKGTLKSTTDAKGSKTFYEYDEMDRITSVSKMSGNTASTNLLTSPSFENWPDGWTTDDLDNSTGRWRIVKQSSDLLPSKYGNSRLECYDSDGLINGSATNAVAYQEIKLPNSLSVQTAYTLSVYAKKIGSDNPILAIRCFDASGNEIPGGYPNVEKAIPENTWVRISHTFMVPAATSKFYAILRSHVRVTHLNMTIWETIIKF